MVEKLKIIELSTVLAGPSVGMFFAELGAEVIKIENKTSDGDITRKWHQPIENKAQPSAYFSSVNWGKTHLMMDFNNKEDKAAIYAMIQSAQVIITNFKYGDDQKFKLSFYDCKKINPSIIYAHLGGFKSDKKRVAFDAIIQAEAGFMSINGEKESSGLKMPIAMMDILAAHQLKEGILVALLKQQGNKKAFLVSTTLEESAFASLANQASNFLMNKMNPEPLGSLHPNIAPYGEIITSSDRIKFILAIGTEKQFNKLAYFLELKEEQITAFNTIQKRVNKRKELLTIIQEKINHIKAETIYSYCLKNNLPIGKIKTIENVFANKIAREMVLEEKIENFDTKRVATVAFTIKE